MGIRKACFLILLGVMLSICSFVQAQSGKIPPFRIVQPNGKVFKAENLPMGKPIVIIYFSPDCDHCEKLTKDFLSREKDFKKASVAMITYQPVDKVAKFVTDYKINKYSNIFVGTEGESFFVRNYYRIYQLPFIALYNKNGDFIKSYGQNYALADLSARLNNLK